MKRLGSPRNLSYIYEVNEVRTQLLIKIRVMLKKIDFKYLVGAGAAFTIAYGTMAGIVQNYIPFAGVDNEMAFCVCALMLGLICLMGVKK